jgi:hypothetical protein
MNSSAILQDILQRLARVRKLQLKTDAQFSSMVFGTLILLLITLVALAELVGGFGSTVRTILAAVVALPGLALFFWFVLRPVLHLVGVLKVPDDFSIANNVGEFFPGVRDRLFNLLQLHKELASGKSLYSPELIDASFQDLTENIRDLDFTRTVDRSSIGRSARSLATTTVGVLLLAVGLQSSLVGAVDRLVHYSREYAQPASHWFEVYPGNREIVKGANIEVSVLVHSASSEPVSASRPQLFSRLQGQSRVEESTLRPDSSGMYRASLQSIRGNTEYYVQLEDVRSEHYTLTVVDRPVIKSMQVRLDFPAYTKLPPRIQDEFIGDVTALAGTKISIRAVASKELLQSRIVFGLGPPLPLSIHGEQLSATFPLKSETTYSLELKDNDGLQNEDPVKYQLKVIPDESPTIAITQPGRNLDLAGSDVLPLVIQIKDDFGFSKLRLGYRLVHSRYEQPSRNSTFLLLTLPTGQSTEGEIPYQWNLAKLSLVPEDVVEYFAEVFDNDVVSGPKSARSQTYLLRLPSLEEVFTDLNKGHEESIDDLKKSMEEAKKLKENLESINQDLKKNKDPDWQQQKKLEEMSKKYKEMQKKLEDVKSRVDDMVQKMNEQKVLSKETLEKYLELQQMMEQINADELQQFLKQMQQAMQNVDKEKLQQALQQMTFSEERFRQGIERTINLLKRIQIEQKVDEAKKRAQDIQQQQKDVMEQTAQGSNDQQKTNELAKKQEDLSAKQQQLERLTKDLEQRMEEFFTEMPAEKLEKLNEQMKQRNLQQQMKQAAQQMRNGQRQQARQQQQQAEQQAGENSQQLDQLQQEMLQNQAQYIMNAMRQAINNLLELSKREEALKQQSQNAPPNSQQLRQNAEDQMNTLQDMGHVLNGLGELAQRSFAITPEMSRSLGEALSRMQSALRALESRNGTQASQDQNGAMAALNKSATQVQQALQQMMQGGNGSGSMGSLLQQLGMMAGQQMGINTGTQQLGNGQLSLEQAAQAARLAQEQEAVRKSLDQLNKEAQESGQRDRILGDLSQISEEMKEVVRNLEQQNVNPETVKKQERILSRLLDASKSMRERDFEKKRKAQTGTQITRKSPDELDPSVLEGNSKLRDDLLKALEQGYSKDYQELIRKYFEQLQKIKQQ